MSPELRSRIGINAIFLETRMAGLDTYIRALIPGLMRLASDINDLAVCDREPEGGFAWEAPAQGALDSYARAWQARA